MFRSTTKIARRPPTVAAILLGVVLALSAWPLSRPAAQEARTIRVVVPFAPGGMNDTLARVVADKLGTRLGRAVIVESRPGAGGIVAARHVISSAPDGDTIMLSTGSLAIHSAKQPAPFDVRTDLQPIAMISRGTLTLYVNSELPVRTFAELVSYSKANPDKLSFGSFGVGTQTHLMLELLKLRTGMMITHVPYRSSQETRLAVVKNEIQVSSEPYQTLKPLVDAGQVRPIVVLAQESDVAGVPSMKDAGVPEVDIYYWSGFHVPARTPAAVVGRLNAEVNAVLQDPQVLSVIGRLGSKPVGGTVEQFARAVQQETEAWTDVIRRANLTLE